MGGQEASARLHDVVAVGTQELEIGLGGGMGIHVEIHGGSDKDGSLHAQVGRDEHVVGHAVSHLGNAAGCGRGYDHGIGPLTEGHMAMP